MAEIQNERDLILQATVPRIIPIFIPIDKVEGLGPKLKSLRIKSTATTFSGDSVTTSPTTITLTAEKMGGLEGTVEWSVISGTGTLTPSGDSATVFGPSVVGGSISVLARVTVDTINYDAQVTLTKLGKLSEQDVVDLTSQVTGQLANGNVSGLGALALLNKVDLNTQTVGALNGQTQVTNLGSLAYANAIAANQIGAGTLAAGVIYAGTINAEKINAGSFSGKNFSGGVFTGSVFRTGASGERLELGNSVAGFATSNLTFYDPDGGYHTIISTRGALFRPPTAYTSGVTGSVRVYYNNTHNGLELEQTGEFRSPLVFQNPTTKLPSPVKGGVFMHSTHGLCISDGTKWLKTTWTPV